MSGAGGSYQVPGATSQGYAAPQQQQQQHPRPPFGQGQPQTYYQQPPPSINSQQQQQQQQFARPPSYGSPAPSPAGTPYTNPQGVQQMYRPVGQQQPYYPPPPQQQQQQGKRAASQARASSQSSSRPATSVAQQQQPAPFQPVPFLAPQHVVPSKAAPLRDPHRYSSLPAPGPLPPYSIQGQAGQTVPQPGATSTGPLPLFAPIVNPRNRNSQACFTSYASRLRTGVSLLMQPILASSTAAGGNQALLRDAPQQGRRRGAVNYAENEKDVTEESSSESSSEGESDDSKEEPDGNFGGRVGRTAVKSKKITGPPVKGGMGSGAGSAKGSGLDRSYLGELPPVEKVVVKPAQRTRHAYHPTEALDAAAKLKETLVPVRIDIDTDTHRIRDAFLWNIHESLSTPEEFAQIFCQDLELPAGQHVNVVAAQIRTQLDEYKGVAEMDVEYAGEHVPVDETAIPVEPAADEAAELVPHRQSAPSVREQTETPGPTTAADSPALVSSRAEPSPSPFGERKRKRPVGDEVAADSDAVDEDEDAEDEDAKEDVSGDEGEQEEIEQEDNEAVIDESVQESDCRIIVNLDVQLSNYSLRDRIEWDLSSTLNPATFATSLCADLGLPSSAVPLLTHAVHEELLRHKKDCLELGFVGAGWSLGQGKTQGGKVVGPRPLEGAWRGWEEGSEFEPVLREVDEEEMEKREAERERSSRRMRRETARFATGTTSRRRR